MTRHQRLLTHLAMFAACASAVTPLVVSAPRAVYAQDDAQLKKLIDEGVENYDMLMLDEAGESLQKAIALIEQKKLRGPNAARAYIMLGITRFAEQKKGEVEGLFIKAVEADPKTDLPAAYKTPELAKIMTSARGKARPPKTDPKTDPKTTNPPASGATFKHDAIATAPAGKPLTIAAVVPPEMPAFRVWLYFRRFGEESYTRRELRPSEGDTSRFEVTLAGESVKTSSIDYYIEAHDRAGKTLASSASAGSPHNISVLGSGKLPDNKVKTDPDPDPDPKPGEVNQSNVYVSLGVGSDLGFIPGGKPTANPGFEGNPGITPAFGHAMFDAGWIINPTMRLGLYFRWQFSPYQDFSGLDASATEGSFPSTKDQCLGLGLSGDCMIGLKYRYYFTPEDKPRFYSSFGMGVGRVRNWLRLEQPTSTGNPAPACNGKETYQNSDGSFCYIRDTIRTGWFHLGLGAGFTAPLTDFMEFSLDSYLMFLFLDQASINLDATASLVFRF